MNQGTRMHEALFASPEGRMLGAGLALTGLMPLAFGVGWHLYPTKRVSFELFLTNPSHPPG